jgi:ABC-type polysaccharide/polyol phosphate export permease
VVFLSDLSYVWGLFCRLLFFITPVFFLPEVAGEGLARTVIESNPLTGLISLAREALLYGGPIDPIQAGLTLIGPFVVLILGTVLFNAVKPKIPDFI